MSGMRGFLAALAGGLGGLGDGLQLNEQMKARAAQLKMAQDEAEARRRSEALNQLVTRDQLGLVQAPQYQGQIGQMLRATPQASETGTPLDSIMSALKPAAGQIALQKERPATVSMQDPITKSMGQYIMDPTQSRAARERTEARSDQMADYTRQRTDELADRGAAQSAATAQRDASNRAAFNALATLQPNHPAVKQPYNPATDYGLVAGDVLKTAHERAQFQQQKELQAQQLAGQLRVAGVRAANSGGGKPIPAGVVKTMIENRGALSRVNAALDGVTKNPGAVGLTNMLGGAWVKNTAGHQSTDYIATRAAVADVGSQIIHDRTGATMTVGEMPRFAPFIPSVNESSETAIPKLRRLKALMEEEAALYEANFGADQGYDAFQAGRPAAPNVANDRPPLTTFVRPR